MMRMLGLEIHRCLHRRLVWVLLALALLGCVVTTLITYRSASHDAATDPYVLVDLHQSGGDSALGAAAFFLVIGAAVGGASMIGAEWRAGTFTTLLTWEPHRRRVASVKLLANGLVAWVLAIVLQVIFIGALLPAAFGPGSTGDVDRAWLQSLGGAAVRIACMTALVAVFMGAVAMIGRSTAAALGFAFGYMILFENLLRAWKPWSGRYLLGENGAVFISGEVFDDLPFSHSVTAAAATLVGYTVLLSTVAVVAFWRRDLASAT